MITLKACEPLAETALDRATRRRVARSSATSRGDRGWTYARPVAAPDPQPGVAELAATLRAQADDLSLYAGMLLTVLSSFPDDVLEVERERRGLLRRTETVTGVTLTLDDRSFRLVRERVGAAPTATVAHVVRGVVLSREQLPLTVWSERLAERLAASAERDAGATAALERLLRP